MMMMMMTSHKDDDEALLFISIKLMAIRNREHKCKCSSLYIGYHIRSPDYRSHRLSNLRPAQFNLIPGSN